MKANPSRRIIGRDFLFHGARERPLIPDRLFNSFTDYRAGRIANRLASFVRTGDTVLDCGCGSMRIAGMLQEQCRIHAFGTDVIRLNHDNHRFCLCSGEQLAFEREAFDVVFLMFTLHHMASPANALIEGLRVSRRLLIVLEDVYRSPFELRLLKLLDWSGNILISNDMSFPFNFKTENEWTAIFKDLGTRLVAMESIRPVPWRPSRHRIFVLEKQPPAYNREGSSTNKETHHVHTQSCPRPEGH